MSLGILLAVWGVALLIIRSLNMPAQGIVTQHNQDAGQNSEQLMSVNGKTATFKYPISLQKIKPDTLAVGDVEKFLFSDTEHKGRSLAIRVKELPGGVLAQNGDYNMRKQNPQQYTEQTLTVNGAMVSIMTDINSMHDKVAFMPHDQLIAEVAFSGGESSDTQSQAIFTTVLNSWQWL